MCKGRDVFKTDLSTMCFGAYYLKNLDAIEDNCEFKLIPGQEHVFQLESSKWLISSSISFPTTIKCANNFTSITIIEYFTNYSATWMSS
jgi:hypothetical protein